MYTPSQDHMKSLMVDILKNHIDAVDDLHKEELLLTELEEDEFDQYLRLSIGYFDVFNVDLYSTLISLQGYLATADRFDKEIVAEKLRDAVFKSIENDMQEFLNSKFNEYKQERRIEGLYNEGFTPKIDQQTGEVTWVKR